MNGALVRHLAALVSYGDQDIFFMYVFIGTRHIRAFHGIFNKVRSLLYKMLMVHIVRRVECYVAGCVNL